MYSLTQKFFFFFYVYFPDFGEEECELELDDLQDMVGCDSPPRPDDLPTDFEPTDISNQDTRTMRQQTKAVTDKDLVIKISKSDVHLAQKESKDSTSKTKSQTKKELEVVVVTDVTRVAGNMVLCMDCNKEVTMNGLKYHLRHTHNKRLAYACSHCSETFQNARDRNNHQQSHTMSVTFCSFCMYSTRFTTDVGRHERKCPENPDNKYVCSKCTKARKFNGEESLQKHFNSSHKLPGDFLCVYCKSLFMKKVDKENHKCSVARKYKAKGGE